MYSLLLSEAALSGASAAPVLDSRAADPRFTLYNLPTALVGPCDLEVGHDGTTLWGQGILANVIFKLDPATGAITEYPIPFTTPFSSATVDLPGVPQSVGERTAFSCAIRKGDDGNLYAGNGDRNQLLRINETTGHIDVFTPPAQPAGNLFPFNDLYSAKDGIYSTATTQNTFSFFSFATEQFTVYQVPTPGALPLGLYVSPTTGTVYVAELFGNKILTFDPSTQAMNEYALPEAAQFPAVIRAERDGHIYFSLFIGDGIGRMNVDTHQIELYHTNQTLLAGSEDTIDKYGGVWLSSFTTDVMSRLDTNTLEFSYVAFPDTFAQLNPSVFSGIFGDVPPVVDIAVNYGPGDKIWFTGLTFNQVGSYDLTGLYS